MQLLHDTYCIKIHYIDRYDIEKKGGGAQKLEGGASSPYLRIAGETAVVVAGNLRCLGLSARI